ncbi:Glycosyltransferase, GT2 family [Methylomagnum ishizawai]|uniref:Glycosyltransferase, GT2 family n=1 Tax=Methylomagnum ishizawai TaxID=1760988 RepID=A0A1Y6D3S6_9GAMM|nr:glycosyltransferase [Methylomagnum ishizawai]SMF95044.1 Glycosyltransferase, GT2 family [Methylomagnum ishizawai]
MTSIQTLQIHAYDDLLILYWRREAKISGQINVFLDDIPMGKPILGMEFVDRPDYLLVAYQPGLAQHGNFRVRIADAEARVLAEAECAKALPLPKKWLATLSPANRLRLENILMLRVAKSFPTLGMVTRRKIALALADIPLTCLSGPDGLFYARLPWSAATGMGLMDVSLQMLPAARSGNFPETMKALLEGGFLHFFSRSLAPYWRRDRVWILEVGETRHAPFQLPELPPIEHQTLGDWLGAIFAGYEGEKTVLKGYAVALFGPRLGDTLATTPQRDTVRLLGKVEGIRAGRVFGWAFHPDRPHHPVKLAVTVDGDKIGETQAHLPRVDSELRAYGNCGFVWQPDEDLLNGATRQFRFHCLETGNELQGSPIQLGGGEYDGDFRLEEDGYLVGWVRERCASAKNQRPYLRLLIDGEREGEIPDGQIGLAQADGRYDFRGTLPDKVFDTQPHSIQIEVVGKAGRPKRLGQALKIQAGYRGYVDTTGVERVSGWVVNTSAPNRPVALDLFVNGLHTAVIKADQVRPDIAEQPGSRSGFEFRIRPQSWECASLTLDLRLAGTELRVLGPSIVYTPYDIALRSLTTLAEILNDRSRWQSLAGGLAFDEDVTTWLRTQIIAKATNELRRAKRIPGRIDLQLASLVKLPGHHERQPIVDVIVPVYLGREDALRCIAGVLATRCQTPMELVVINDASPDADLSAELRNLSQARRFTYLENKDNLGFVGTVNRGMRLHPGRDVVLLNSDTAVAGAWLDRLRGAAYHSGNIGTATPLSNNATICSFPGFCRENPIPPGLSVERLDALFAESNPGLVVDIPTAVGFCMYIKRDTLDEVGYFDEAQWGKGYGEENDFCLRAATLGWRHVAACDVFVEHEGGVSFAENKKDQIQRNLAKLNGLYPDYAATIQRFIVQDPMAQARNPVSKALLREHAPRYMLFVIHSLGGGTQSAADYLAAGLAREGVPVLELMSITAERWQLVCHGLPYTIHYRYPEDWARLIQDLRDLRVWHIHYHQTMHYPKRIWELPRLLGTAYDFTAHDYLPICPRINMIDETGYYCGASQFTPEACTRCVKLNGLEHDLDDKYAEFGSDVGAWRAVYGEVLGQARRIFAPSEDVAQRFREHFPLSNLRVLPHLEPRCEIPAVRQGEPYTVAVIGAIGVHKGSDILLRCVRNAEKEGLPLRFVIIGYTGDDQAFSRFGNVSIYGAYQREDLPRLIEASQARIALFLSPWPETYCFALSEAWQNGLYPLALDIGAVGERIRCTKAGRLLPLTASPRRINRTLMKLFEAEPAFPAAVALGWEPPEILKDYYDLSADVAMGTAETTLGVAKRAIGGG